MGLNKPIILYMSHVEMLHNTVLLRDVKVSANNLHFKEKYQKDNKHKCSDNFGYPVTFC